MLLEKLNNFMVENYNESVTNPFSCKGYKTFQQIDVKASEENLELCADILDEFDINYRIMFGTLLGIYRDGALIPHDTDVDIVLPYTEQDKIMKALPIMEERGFDIIRYLKNNIISIGRKDNYVDLYFFKPVRNRDIYECVGAYFLPESDFYCDNTITFKDREYPTISNPEEFFKVYYGSDWRTPIKDLHANPHNINRRG